MSAEAQKYFVIWIAAVLPAILLMAGAGYNIFMYMKASQNLSTKNKITQGVLGPFSLFFNKLNTKEGARYLKQAYIFAIAFAFYVGVVFFVFYRLTQHP